MKGTSKVKLYEQFDLESLQLRLWSKKLCYFCKFYKNEFLQYLYGVIPIRESSHSAISNVNISLTKTKNSIFSSAIIQWSDLDLRFLKSKSFIVFNISIHSFKKTSPNKMFNYCHNPKWITFIRGLYRSVFKTLQNIYGWAFLPNS